MIVERFVGFIFMWSTILFILIIVLAAYVAVALILIATQHLLPADKMPDHPFGFDPTEPRYRQPESPLEEFEARDGTKLGFRRYFAGKDDAPLLFFIHGSTNHGGMYEPLAQKISSQGIADVVVPTMRGHGELCPIEKRGIADYETQLEEDVADLIKRVAKPGQKVIVGGHSLGGGFAIRFSTGIFKDLVSAALLLAPYLNKGSPAQRPNAGGFTRVMRRRALGQVMLGMGRFFRLHRLPVVQFNFGEEYRKFERSWLSTDRYNFDMVMGFGTRGRWRRDVANLPPFLMIVGGQDEVFYANKIEPTMAELTDQGEYLLLKDKDHIEISHEQVTVDAFAGFLKQKEIIS